MRTRFLQRHPDHAVTSRAIAACDPAETEGAAVVVSLSPRPTVERIVAWRKRDRKTGIVWSVSRWSIVGGHVVDDAVSLVGTKLPDVESFEADTLTGAIAYLFRDFVGVRTWPDAGVVEGIGDHGRKSGAIALAESAGVARAVFEAETRRTVARPHVMRWCPDVLGVPGNLPAPEHRLAVLGALTGSPVVGRRSVVEWGVSVPEPFASNEHVADAVGIGLWGLGFRLTGERDSG